MKNRILAALVVLTGLSLPTLVGAQSETVVKFRPGDFGTMVSGSVRGDEYHDYMLAAKQGQEIFAELTATGGNGDGTIYFNVLPPSSDDVAIYNGSMDGNTALVLLPRSGTYTIRVYLMGNDEDAGKQVDYNLDLSIQYPGQT